METMAMDGLMEIFIMSLVLARLIFSLIGHGFFIELSILVFLSLFAFFVEFQASHSNKLRIFNPRVGTLSGIYTGALTIPCVLAAQMIQHHRIIAVTSNLNGYEDFMSQFWAAVASSMGLLIYVWTNLNGCISSINNTITDRSSIISSKSTILWTTLSIVILSIALSFPIKIVNVASVVVLSTWLLQYGVHAFPGCTSLGETILLSNGLSVFGNSFIAHILAKYDGNLSSVSYALTSNKDIISAILQGILIAFPWVPVMYKAFGTCFSWFLWCFQMHLSKSLERICSAMSFVLALCIAMMMITLGWLNIIYGMKDNLITWVMNFIFEDKQRYYLCGYWIFVISTAIIPLYMAKSTKIETIMVRKFFHLMVVVMFVPALLFQQDFLSLAFCVAFAAFLVVEMVRVLRIPPFGDCIHKFMAAFTDSRDSDLLIISHFSLLLGCALPVWLTNSLGDRALAPFAGVFSIGIGDTMASVVGYNFGSLRLSHANKKTLEGTVAGIVSVLVACLIILKIMNVDITSIELHSLMIAVVCTGLMEAYTTQLDNAFLPLIFYSLLIA